MEPLPAFDPSQCGCSWPNARPPCGYCENGEYDMEKYDLLKEREALLKNIAELTQQIEILRTEINSHYPSLRKQIINEIKNGVDI